jgi:hypothetical protein
MYISPHHLPAFPAISTSRFQSPPSDIFILTTTPHIYVTQLPAQYALALNISPRR